MFLLKHEPKRIDKIEFKGLFVRTCIKIKIEDIFIAVEIKIDHFGFKSNLCGNTKEEPFCV